MDERIRKIEEFVLKGKLESAKELLRLSRKLLKIGKGCGEIDCYDQY